jgi:hypothetical protein
MNKPPSPRPSARLVILLITIVLLGAQACSTPKPMDVVWSNDNVDDNLVPRNPGWYQMMKNGQRPDVCALCPCSVGVFNIPVTDPQAWKAAPNCTNQLIHTNSSLECFGHWNWFPVEYEGKVTWGGHSNSWYDDDDYYLQVKRDDQALETLGHDDGLHIEFDSSETVDYWDNTNTWWDGFHHNFVDQGSGSVINGREVIVIGMLGLDENHGVPPELNPVYVMFVHLISDYLPEDRWAFFVKNWGNEGYCGDNQELFEPLARNTIKVRIRHPGATAFNLLSQNVYSYGDDENEFRQQSWNYQRTPDGVLLTFHLRDPATHSGFVGDLKINWGDALVIQQKSENRAATETKQSATVSAAEEGDMSLKCKIDKLDSSAQKLLYQQVKNLAHHPKAQISQGTLSSSPFAEPTRPTAAIPNYDSVVRSVADPARRAKRNHEREFILSFLKAHGIE